MYLFSCIPVLKSSKISANPLCPEPVTPDYNLRGQFDGGGKPGQFLNQAHRRVVESGPAEASGKCRRHESGEGTRGWSPPLVSGGRVGDLPEKIFELSMPVRSF